MTFDGISSSGALGRAVYSLDGGDWQVIFPVGLLSDSQKEPYEIRLAESFGRPAHGCGTNLGPLWKYGSREDYGYGGKRTEQVNALALQIGDANPFSIAGKWRRGSGLVPLARCDSHRRKPIDNRACGREPAHVSPVFNANYYRFAADILEVSARQRGRN